jgi:hypothetical protein
MYGMELRRVAVPHGSGSYYVAYQPQEWWTGGALPFVLYLGGSGLSERWFGIRSLYPEIARSPFPLLGPTLEGICNINCLIRLFIFSSSTDNLEESH